MEDAKNVINIAKLAITKLKINVILVMKIHFIDLLEIIGNSILF